MQETGNGFRLVDLKKSLEQKLAKWEHASPVQSGLFPSPTGHSVIFVVIPAVSEQEFLSLVQSAQPGLAVELRQAPRFDIGNLTRKAVLQQFNDVRCTYLDPVPRREFASAEIDSWLAPIADICRKNPERPIMFFLSTAQNIEALRRRVCDFLNCAKEGWTVIEVPACKPSQPLRALAR
jgi:hypothetical protein